MGKNVIEIDGQYFIVDDETAEIKQVVIKDHADLTQEQKNKILKYYITHQKKG